MRPILSCLAVLVLTAGCGPRGGTTAAPPTSPGSGPPTSGSPDATVPLAGALTVWTIPQGDDEKPLKAYEKEFEKLHPGVDVKLLVVPEDGYVAKVTTALQAHNPPDVALIEPDLQGLMKSRRVVELSDHYRSWGVHPADFNEGGLDRLTLEGDLDKGIYAVGDALFGNVLVYNRALFDAKGVPYPPIDRSLTYQEYAEICRKLAQPASNPAEAVYGCSMPDWSLLFYPVFGEDGRQAVGNLNKPEVAEAFEIGAGLIRDKVAPGSSILDTIGESDLFAEGRIAITWTDSTEIPKYQEQEIDFGFAPFFVVEGQDDFVDTWTPAYGTFTESKNQPAALEFLRFIATDAQRIRPTISADPPLSETVAAEIGYGEGDPVKQQYLEVLKNARGSTFGPPGVEAWDPAEVLRLLTVEGETDAQPILDEMAEESQKELDRAWQQWESLGS